MRIAIVGAGFAGVGMAVVLRRAGFTDLVVFERGDRVGGTWRDNAYPGAACDVPSHLYSFSFAPKHDWAHKFSRQADILAYIEDVADRFGVRDSIRLGTAVHAATYAQSTQEWRLTLSDGTEQVFDILIPAVGQLSVPSIPAFAGLSDFQGRHFHASRWDASAKLENAHVAIVGSAASAVQIVPELAKTCGKLSVFQRSPNWIIPRGNHAFGTFTQGLFKKLPIARRALRSFIYSYQESLFGAFRTGSRRNRWVTGMARKHLAAQVADPDLRARLTPGYTLGCKRLLVSDDYLPSFSRPNVELVTETIERFTPTGIRTLDGQERAFDTVVFATGFDVRNSLAPVKITGRDGTSLSDTWRDGPHAYLGVTVPAFPNMFLLYGPNTNLGHSSIIFMLECQFGYIRQCIEKLAASDAGAMDVRQAVCDAYNAKLHASLAGTVWSTGCGNWYGQGGRITANWSGSTTQYWRQMRAPALSDFTLEQRALPA